MKEIERKFLVSSEDFRALAHSKKLLVQGFLNTHPDRTVRVRITEDLAFLTVKGRSSASGTTRFEWESAISVADARALLELCEQPLIEKYRYRVPVGQHCYEVDEFLGANSGLIVAEIELKSEEEAIEKPAWLGREVTGNIAYYNSQLIKKPYNKWK